MSNLSSHKQHQTQGRDQQQVQQNSNIFKTPQRQQLSQSSVKDSSAKTNGSKSPQRPSTDVKYNPNKYSAHPSQKKEVQTKPNQAQLAQKQTQRQPEKNIRTPQRKNNNHTPTKSNSKQSVKQLLRTSNDENDISPLQMSFNEKTYEMQRDMAPRPTQFLYESPVKRTNKFEQMRQGRQEQTKSGIYHTADATLYDATNLSPQSFGQESMEKSYTSQASKESAYYWNQRISHFTMHLAAKKIQRVFKAYLLWQRIKRRNEMSVERKRQIKLQKILATKLIVKHIKQWLQVKKARQARRELVDKIVTIQRWFKSIRSDRYFARIQKAQQTLYALFQGWQTRKIVNSLAKDVQAFVNSEDPYNKARLRRNFHLLFDNVCQNKLWLTKNESRLQRLLALQTNGRANTASRQSLQPEIINESIQAQQNRRPQNMRTKEKSMDVGTRKPMNRQSLSGIYQQTSIDNRDRRTKSGEYITLGIRQNHQQRVDKSPALSQSRNTHSTTQMQSRNSLSRQSEQHDTSTTISTNVTPTNTSSKSLLGKRVSTATSKIDCWRVQNTSQNTVSQNTTARDKSPLTITTINTQNTMKDNKHANSFSNMFYTATEQEPKYKSIVKEITSVLDTLNEINKQRQLTGVKGKQQMSIGQKSKMNFKFNKLINDLKEQYEQVNEAINRQ